MEREATEDHLEVLAREGSFDWKALRPHLGLSSGHEQDISRSERDDYAGQRRACLYKWKVVKGSGATYEELIKAANKIGNRKFAEMVEEVMKTPSRESTSNNTAVIEKPQGSCVASYITQEVALPAIILLAKIHSIPLASIMEGIQGVNC